MEHENLNNKEAAQLGIGGVSISIFDKVYMDSPFGIYTGIVKDVKEGKMTIESHSPTGKGTMWAEYDIEGTEWKKCEQEKVVKNLRIADVLALDIPAVSGSALDKVVQYNQLKKEMQEEILHLKTIIDDLSYLFNIGTVEERKELQGKISKLEWAVYQMKHCL